MGRELHPEIYTLLTELDNINTSDFADLSVERSRQLHDELLASEKSERDSVGRIRDLKISGPNGPIPIRIYEPETEGPRPLYVNYHGGG